MSSLLPSVFFLGLLALLAALRARARPLAAANTATRSAAAAALLLAVAAQSMHFTEETLTGFHERFPALFGQPPMPFGVFVAFNLIWIGIWVASIRGLRAGNQAASFAAWFLAFAGVANLVAHPLMALASGGYFPGLVTAPLVGAACAWLWKKLAAAPQPAS